MKKLKKGDDVVVIAGRDKGKRGSISRMAGDNHVFVDGVNMVKRHTRGNPNAGVAGGIIEKEAAIHISNVAIFNPKTKKADRVGIQTGKDGRKVRVFKSNTQVID